MHFSLPQSLPPPGFWVEEGGGVEDDAEEALPGLEKAANDVVNDAAEKLGDALKELGL